MAWKINERPDSERKKEKWSKVNRCDINEIICGTARKNQGNNEIEITYEGRRKGNMEVRLQVATGST
jgi:hypothetical protein